MGSSSGTVVEASPEGGFAVVDIDGERATCELFAALDGRAVRLFEGDVVSGTLRAPRSPNGRATLANVLLVTPSSPPASEVEELRRLCSDLQSAGLNLSIDAEAIADAKRRYGLVNAGATPLACCGDHSPLQSAIHEQLEFVLRVSDDDWDHPLDDPTLCARLAALLEPHLGRVEVEVDAGARSARLSPQEVVALDGDDMEDPASFLRALMERLNQRLEQTGAVERFSMTSGGTNWVFAPPRITELLQSAEVL